MRTEVLELDNRFGEEYAGRYVFQEISWARRSRIIQKYTKYHPITGQVVDADYVAIQAETIWASLREQPSHKPVTLEKLLSEEEDGIPVQLGELFSQIVNRLCSVSIEETRFLSEQSDAGKPIQQSRSLGFAKSLDGRRTSLQNNRRKLSKNSSSS